MYCGDEVASFVLDVGTYSTKYGFGGQASPRGVFNTLVGIDSTSSDSNSSPNSYKVGDTLLSKPRVHAEYRTPYDEAGKVKDWDSLEKVWKYAWYEADPTRKQSFASFANETKPNINLAKQQSSTLSSGLDENQMDLIDENEVEKQDILPHACPDLPFLLSVPSWIDTHIGEQEKMLEIGYESMGVPAMYLGKSGMLSAFSTGRSTALICEMSYSGLSATPVIDGLIMQRPIVRSCRGGKWLDLQLSTMASKLTNPNQNADLPFCGIYPQSMVKRRKSLASLQDNHPTSSPTNHRKENKSLCAPLYQPNLSQYISNKSLYKTICMEPIRVLREDRCLVRQVKMHNGNDTSKKGINKDEEEEDDSEWIMEFLNENQINRDPYELPDGTQLLLKEEMIIMPEILFIPSNNQEFIRPSAVSDLSYWKHTQAIDNITTLENHENLKRKIYDYAVHEMCYRSLERCDVDSRKDLCGHIILSGGCSLTKGLSERLTYELMSILPASIKSKVVVPLPIERAYTTWLGGSVLVTCGSFQQLWLSKAEYEEQGPLRSIDRFA